METIEIGKGESFTLNPLEGSREAPDLLVNLIAQIGEVVLDAEQKLALREVIVGLPHGATMLDLIAVLKAKEAAELGISLEQYEALTPLFLALQAMQAKGAYSHLLAHGGDK